jgi:hypothetical protein
MRKAFNIEDVKLEFVIVDKQARRVIAIVPLPVTGAVDDDAASNLGRWVPQGQLWISFRCRMSWIPLIPLCASWIISSGMRKTHWVINSGLISWRGDYPRVGVPLMSTNAERPDFARGCFLRTLAGSALLRGDIARLHFTYNPMQQARADHLVPAKFRCNISEESVAVGYL